MNRPMQPIAQPIASADSEETGFGPKLAQQLMEFLDA